MAFFNNKYKIKGEVYWLDDSYKVTPTSYKGVSYSYYIEDKLQTKIPYSEYYTGVYALSDGVAFASSCYGDNQNELIRGGRSDYTPYSISFTALTTEPYCVLTVQNKDGEQLGSKYRYYKENFMNTSNPTIKIWVGMVGGGGGGGRSEYSTEDDIGASGGGAGGACFFPLILSADNALIVDIGKGGKGGTGGWNGSKNKGEDGGDTIAYLNKIADENIIAIAHGGKGGTPLSSVATLGGSCENKGSLNPFYELKGGNGGGGANKKDGNDGKSSSIRFITADYAEIVDAWNNGALNPGGKGAKYTSGWYLLGGGGGAASFKGSKGGGYENASAENPSAGTVGGGGAGSSSTELTLSDGCAGGWGQFAVWVPVPSNTQ